MLRLEEGIVIMINIQIKNVSLRAVVLIANVYICVYSCVLHRDSRVSRCVTPHD